MNLILCGLPGSGKTSVGQCLAARLSLPFIDIDRLIEERFSLAGKQESCREIARREGEVQFRAFEEQVIASLSGCKDLVIATGGGSLLRDSNLKVLQSIGLLIYLQADPAVILPRLLAKGLPTYLDPLRVEDSFQELVKRRIPLFKEACQLVIETHALTPDEIAKAILKLIKNPFFCTIS